MDDDVLGAVTDDDNEASFLLLDLTLAGDCQNSKDCHTWTPLRIRAGMRESLKSN